MIAIPNFTQMIRQARFDNKINEVVSLFEKARTQALASELDNNQKIPPGGFGVLLDQINQDAILFIDDWNDSESKDVSVNYGREDISNRVLPDQIFTAGQDTVIETIAIDEFGFIKLNSVSGESLNSPGGQITQNLITIIFLPPQAEVKMFGDVSGELQNLEIELELTIGNVIREIKFNRVTTTPEITKN